MEGLNAPMRSGNVAFSEYLLQGSILEGHRDSLLHRLNGLCDPTYTGPEKFHEHEMVYQIGGNASMAPMTLRVRRAMDHPEAPWHVRYVGQPDMSGDKSRHTMIRSWLEAGTSSNVAIFLQELGFRLDHEFVLKGYLFRKGRMKITVCKVFKILEQGNIETLEPLLHSYLVEVSVVAPYGQDKVQEDMRNFTEQLKPYRATAQANAYVSSIEFLYSENTTELNQTMAQLSDVVTKESSKLTSTLEAREKELSSKHTPPSDIMAYRLGISTDPQPPQPFRQRRGRSPNQGSSTRQNPASTRQRSRSPRTQFSGRQPRTRQSPRRPNNTRQPSNQSQRRQGLDPQKKKQLLQLLKDL